jgi:hypothetical protein
MALALIISNRKKVLAGITLAVCGYVQTPLDGAIESPPGNP